MSTRRILYLTAAGAILAAILLSCQTPTTADPDTTTPTLTCADVWNGNLHTHGCRNV